MKSATLQTPQNERFNTPGHDDTLNRFSWFEIMPCRQDKTDGTINQCAAEHAEFWTIYGRENIGSDEEPEYLARAVHDETEVRDIVRVARRIVLEGGKGVVVGCAALGQFPRRAGQVVPVTDLSEIADDLMHFIHDDNDERIQPVDRRDDDFDTHPFAQLREALLEYSTCPAPIGF